MADLRDDKVVRASYFSQLLDLEGNDLKKVYEPISNQIGYVMCFFILLMTAYFAWKRYKRWKEETTRQFVPYKIIKTPTSMLSEQKPENGKGKKRVCAVVGGTGFIGSHIVNELVNRGDYYVFVLGRKFRPERTNPNADCLIQVDLMDLDGLINAFQGVDSIVNAAAYIPNVFMGGDEVYSKNRLVTTHLIKAAVAAKVKTLVHVSGIHFKNRPKDPVFVAFMNAFSKAEEEIAAFSGEDGLHTCVIGPPNIVGLNSPLFDQVFAGKIKSLPMSDLMPTSFVPADYLAKALVNAECKLTDPDTRDQVSGKIFQLRGEPMSWSNFFALQGWPHKITKVSSFIMNTVVKINVISATLFRWAPFGADLAPFLTELMEAVEEDLSEEEVQEVYKALGVGPPNPPMAEYIKLLAERCQEKENKKEQ